MEICSCCGEEMTQVEVLESYLEQFIERAHAVCSALYAEYSDEATQQRLMLVSIHERLVEAANLTEELRMMTEPAVANE